MSTASIGYYCLDAVCGIGKPRNERVLESAGDVRYLLDALHNVRVEEKGKVDTVLRLIISKYAVRTDAGAGTHEGRKHLLELLGDETAA